MDEERKRIAFMLSRFTKNEIYSSVLDTFDKSRIAKKCHKNQIIKVAIIILTEKFSDLDELILFLELKKYHLNQPYKRRWNTLEIKDGKRFKHSSDLTSEKLKASMDKYFFKYNVPFKTYCERKGNCFWTMVSFGRTHRPACFVAHVKLSVIFCTNILRKYSLLIQKVLRKTYRGKDIVELANIHESAEYIEKLNIKPSELYSQSFKDTRHSKILEKDENDLLNAHNSEKTKTDKKLQNNLPDTTILNDSHADKVLGIQNNTEKLNDTYTLTTANLSKKFNNTYRLTTANPSKKFNNTYTLTTANPSKKFNNTYTLTPANPSRKFKAQNFVESRTALGSQNGLKNNILQSDIEKVNKTVIVSNSTKTEFRDKLKSNKKASEVRTKDCSSFSSSNFKKHSCRKTAKELPNNLPDTTIRNDSNADEDLGIRNNTKNLNNTYLLTTANPRKSFSSSNLKQHSCRKNLLKKTLVINALKSINELQSSQIHSPQKTSTSSREKKISHSITLLDKGVFQKLHNNVQGRNRDHQISLNSYSSSIQEIRYAVKSNAFGSRQNTDSVCVVTFEGADIANGLRKLQQMGIIEGSIPSFLTEDL